jgi:type IX secretion system PorP/SprF family membrane protein
MNIKQLGLLLCVCHCFILSAQDEHFSQFYAIPMHMNPALTGAYEGTYRMNLVYRSQWGNTFNTPYRTIAAGGDTRIPIKIQKRSTGDHIGIGLFFINDEVSEFQASANKLSAYGAYHKKLGKKNTSFIGAGIKLGIIQRNINYGNLNFQDQFNQVDGFDLPSNELFPPNNFGRIDVSTGINYSIQLPKSTYYVGVGYHHITNPTFSYFSLIDPPPSDADISQVLESKLSVHLSIDKKLNYDWIFQPRIVYQMQGIHNQIDLGSNIEYIFDTRNSAIVFGLWATGLSDLDGFHIENITPLIGLRQKQFILGLSYDVHLRDTFDSVFGYNTFELSLRFSGVHENSNGFCPTF